MATRFYIQNGLGSEISPDFSARWDSFGRQLRHHIITEKYGSTTAYGFVIIDSTSPYDVCYSQYISNPLQAQTISGNIKGQIACCEIEPGFCAAVIVKVVSNDGSILRGTLLEYFPDILTSEFELYGSYHKNRFYPPENPVYELSIQEGDRIVFEVGYRSFTNFTDHYIGLSDVSLLIVDDTTGDLPEDETTLNVLDPYIFPRKFKYASWIELSQDLLFSEYEDLFGYRMYFPSGITAPVSPSFSASWQQTTGTDRLFCCPQKQSTAFELKTTYESIVTNPYTVLNRQYISDPLQAQILNGHIRGQLKCNESVSDANFNSGFIAKVVSNDGSILRGTLLEYFPTDSTCEYSTTLTNKYFPTYTAISEVEIQEGDRLVFEFGTNSVNSSAVTYSTTQQFGDYSGSDLPINETEELNYCPFIEFFLDSTTETRILFLDEMEVTQLSSATEYSEDDPSLHITQLSSATEYSEDDPALRVIQTMIVIEYQEPIGGLFFLHA